MPDYITRAGFHGMRVKVSKAGEPERYEMRLLERGSRVTFDEDPAELEKRFPNKFLPAPASDTPEAVTPQRIMAVSMLIEDKSNNWSEDDRAFLQSLNSSGFERILKREQQVREQLRQSVEQGPQVAKVQSKFGADCTDQFQEAYDNGYKVFITEEGKYHVCRADKLTKSLNRTPLEKDGVATFVLQYMTDMANG